MGDTARLTGFSEGFGARHLRKVFGEDVVG